MTFSLPKEGNPAPTFKLEGITEDSSSKTQWSNQGLLGRWVVLYFYPKDFTSGCTLEAKGFDRLTNEFKSLNTQILGISADSIEDHKSFCSKEKLSYPLLSDKKGETSKAYGSWKEPFSLRNTFLINPEGKIEKKWLGVRPVSHPMEVLETIKGLQNKT